MNDLNEIIKQNESFIKITGASSEDAVKILITALFASSKTTPTEQQYNRAEQYFTKEMNK